MPHAFSGAALPRLSALSLAVASLFTPAAFAQESSQLKELVVTASGSEQEIKDAPASITVIDRQELQQKRFSSLAEALQDVEGVDVGAAAGKTGGLNISIRGMPSEYTLVLIDGRRQNSAGNVTPNGFGETQTSFMPPVSAIERIEVIRGPMSTLYGSDAMGGVINIITRKVAKEWTGAATVDYTLQQRSDFGDTHSGKFYLSGPIKQDLLGLQLRGSTFRREAAEISYYDISQGEVVVPWMGANPVKSDIRTFGTRLTLTPTRNHDLSIDVDLGRQRYDNATGQLGTLGTGGYGPEQRYNRDQYTLAHTGRYSFGRWDTSYMVNETETVGRTIPPGLSTAVAGTPRTLEVKSEVFDTKLVTGLGNHLVTLGGQWWRAEMKDGVVREPFSFTQQALFIEDEWRIVDNFALTLGARYDDHSVFGGKASPRIYGVWNATPNWTLKGGVSNGYKTPRVEQLTEGINGFGSQGRVPLIGSPGLKPETSTSYEIGTYFDNLAGFTASASIFHNEFTDKITSGPGVPNCSFRSRPNRAGCKDFGNWPNVDTFGQQINVDEATTQGLELATRVPFNKAWSSRLNYTYTRSEQKSGPNIGKPLTDTPEHALNASLHWQPGGAWSGWLRAEFRSDRFRDPGTSAATIAAKDALGDYKGYGLLHLGGAYQVNKQLAVNFAVYNLLNKNFVDYQAYSVPGRPPTITYGSPYVNNYDGRRLWVSATYEF